MNYKGYNIEIESFWNGSKKQWEYTATKDDETFGGCCFDSPKDAITIAKQTIDEKESE